MTTFLSNPTTCGTRCKATVGSESQLSSSDAKTPFYWLFQIPKILRTHFRCMTSFISPGPISIWDFYFYISEWHIHPARAWTPALMLHLTNPCSKRKVLSLAKPKGKIYKTKSLGHYITSSAQSHSQRAVTKSGNILGCSAEDGFLPAIVYVYTIFFQYISYHTFPSHFIIWTPPWPKQLYYFNVLLIRQKLHIIVWFLWHYTSSNYADKTGFADTLSLSLSLSHVRTRTIRPNYPSLLAGLQDWIWCLHRADVSETMLVG